MRLKINPTLILILLYISQQAYSWTGISTFGEPKYKDGFTSLEYADPKAVKGGKIIWGIVGSFDSLNPFSAKGLPPLFISNLLFQSLSQPVMDNPFTKYPEIAKDFELAPDKLSLIVSLKENAVFADGSPITSEDVKFSFDLFRGDQVSAMYKTYWADVKELKIIDKKKVQFIFAKVNNELPMITTELTVLSKAFYGAGDFSKDFVSKALGSGPYIVKDFARDSYIKYVRNDKFWGTNDPFYIGRFNFDEIVVKFYKDQVAMLEDFKKGEFDIFYCSASKMWAKDLVGPQYEANGPISKETWPHKNNMGALGFFFNLRKEIFKDMQVRKAITLAMDFPWINKTLFYDSYIESKSFFENSVFKAENLPDSNEKSYLEELKRNFPNEIPEDVFSIPMGEFGGGMSIKERLKMAQNILKEGGYKVEKGVMVGPKGPLVFNFMVIDGPMVRVIEPFLDNLKKIGIQGKIVLKEESVYEQNLMNKDFDMVTLSVPQSQSPGNEQISLWGSTTSEQKYSRNHYGLQNKAVDAVIDKLIYSTKQEDLIFYTRTLDRILYHLHIAVPNWYSQSYRLASWKKFKKPKEFPSFYSPFEYYEFMWYDADSVKKFITKTDAPKP